MFDWIPIYELLPESYADVLVYCKNGAQFVAHRSDSWNEEFDWFTKGPLGSGRKIMKGRVTHWQPLPKAPKED